jgi:Mrp family chromosome partitioning ATPase/capsular polysaccharide biosynthesis protein
VIRRRLWIIVLVALLLPIPTVLLTSKQDRTYRAESALIPTQQTFVSNVFDPAARRTVEDAERAVQTQADLARAPEVLERVIEAAGVDMTAEELLAASQVAPAPNAERLEFTVTDDDPEVAVTLANTYSREFAGYRRELDVALFERARKALDDSIRNVERALRRPENAPGTAAAVALVQRYSSLVNRAEDLDANRALGVQELVVVPAVQPTELGPQPLRNGLLAFGFGLIFGIALAFVRDALDTRVRSAEEIGRALGLPLFGRLPAPPRRLERENGLVMLKQPRHPQAEAFRMLRTNLDFANLVWGARTIMFASASEAEGRTTTIANLGVAFARAGRHVTLVDLDLRRPSLASYFGLNERPGLTDVALGHVDLTGALATVPLGTGLNRGEMDMSPDFDGRLDVLTAGSRPPDVGEFVGTQALAETLAEVRDQSELVFIDVPPLLAVGDGVALSAKVDALVVIVRLDAVRHAVLEELQRVLDVCPPPKLGYVVTGVPDSGYVYGDVPRVPARSDRASVAQDPGS